MIKKSILILALLFLTSGIAYPASAEIPVVSCGIPEAAALETDPGGEFCDIYTRQLAYREEARKFRELIRERQKNYVAPGIKAVNQYHKNVREMHGFNEPEKSGESAANEDLIGPPAPDELGINP